MNKKEVTEIRKHFKSDDDLLTLNRVVVGIINSNFPEPIRYCKSTSYSELTDSEIELYYKTLKNVVSTKVGKRFREYTFPNSAFSEGTPHRLLCDITSSEFKDDIITDSFISHIANNYASSIPYAIISGHFTYVVFMRNRNDEVDKFTSYEYNFIVTAICPIGSREGSFSYNFSNNEFLSDTEMKLFIDRKPSDGFLFPAFSDRASDMSHVMYYTSSKIEDSSIVDDVLGCRFCLSASGESSVYQNLIEHVFDASLTYEMVQYLNTLIKNYYTEHVSDTEEIKITNDALYRMFVQVATKFEITPIDSNKFTAIYEAIAGGSDVELSVVNILSEKFTVDSGNVKVHIPIDATVSVFTTNGHTKITIDTDDACIVNKLLLHNS